MSVSRRFVAAAAVALVTMAVAISFSGVASGASAPSLPSGFVSVHASPGQVATKFVGTSCGGYITVDAIGRGGGSGKVSCGHASLAVAASPGGSFDSTFASPSAATLVCQANAKFASRSVDVICSENVD